MNTYTSKRSRGRLFVVGSALIGMIAVAAHLAELYLVAQPVLVSLKPLTAEELKPQQARTIIRSGPPAPIEVTRDANGGAVLSMLRDGASSIEVFCIPFGDATKKRYVGQVWGNEPVVSLVDGVGGRGPCWYQARLWYERPDGTRYHVDLPAYTAFILGA